jgi:purine nucleosidase
MSEKILLDTDIGSDIDDAVALAYLLANPACELLGITTVTGEAKKRAMLASALCIAAGRDIPIYPGAEEPLLTAQAQPLAPQARALGNWDHRTEFLDGEAVEFMRRTIRRHPGEITLLTIGPLTNIALLFRTDPEIPRLLKRVVSMCGAYTNRFANTAMVEWNVVVDPHAAAIVYKAGVGLHRSVGIEVTGQVTMPSAEVRERFTGGILDAVRDFSEVWFEERELLTFHDPLVAVTLFHDDVCTFERGTVLDVELKSDWVKGQIFWVPADNGRHEVAVAVDPAKFFSAYFSVFKGK